MSTTAPTKRTNRRPIEATSYDRLAIGTRVKLRVEIRQNAWNPETGHYDIPRTFRVGRQGTVTSQIHAGFRGIEHTITFPNGHKAFGVNATQVTPG
jgi:peptidoglycan/xylan/chitin deacetylase (PgdA/CDA1 family)